jgi:uncharacterized protein
MTHSNTLHEDRALLPPETLDRHRAIQSLMEELEAVDWYDQRVQACGDPELRAILIHNRDEEKEHAAMLLEWLRRNDATFEQHLRTYLFGGGSITAKENGEPAPVGADERPQVAESLALGSLRQHATGGPA